MRAATTMAGEKVRPWRGAVSGARQDDRRRRLDLALALLPPPLEEDLVGVEAEVEGVVAQEALRVDRARQLAVVAALEGAQVARPDLRVALGAIQIDALALTGREQPLAEAAAGSATGIGRSGRGAGLASAAGLVSGGHADQSVLRGRDAAARSGVRIPDVVRIPDARRRRPSRSDGRRTVGQAPGSSMSAWLTSQLSRP